MTPETEQSWFRKIATVLMVAGLCVGATPFVNKWISPTAQAKR